MSDINKAAFAGLGKHFVTLSFVQTSGKPPKETSHIISGFILSCAGQWFYITAGHAIEAIKILHSAGAIFDRWRLSDATAGGEYPDKALPYDFDIDDWAFINEHETGADCAAIPITGITRMGLEAGGVKPLEENAWMNAGEPFDQWLLYGTPSETVEYNEESVITARTVMVAAKQCDPPSNTIAPKDQLLYAKLIDDSINVVNDIDGMSGGPIFGVQHIPEGFRYSIIGIQAGWYKHQRMLVICPIADFASQLLECVKSAQINLVNAQRANAQS